MERKEKLINDILVAMRPHLSARDMSILQDVLKDKLYGLSVTEEETGLACADQTNDYIFNLFWVKKGEKLSCRTADQYVRHAKALSDMAGKPLTMIVESDVDYFLRQCKRRGNQNSTINNVLRFLSAFFSWMRKSKLIRENPCENVDGYKVAVKKIEHLEPEQWERLKTGCRSTRDRALLEFMRCTAMRDGEIPAVRICDIDWHEGRIVIFGEKGHRYRLVCIDRVAKEYLLRYLEERGYQTGSREPLFVGTRTGGVLKKSGIYSAVKEIAKRAQMPVNVYPHLIRKTTATNIIRRGGTSEEAGEYLGHVESTTAGRFYAYKGDDHIVEIFRQRVAAV